MNGVGGIVMQLAPISVHYQLVHIVVYVKPKTASSCCNLSCLFIRLIVNIKLKLCCSWRAVIQHSRVLPKRYLLRGGTHRRPALVHFTCLLERMCQQSGVSHSTLYRAVAVEYHTTVVTSWGVSNKECTHCCVPLTFPRSRCQVIRMKYMCKIKP